MALAQTELPELKRFTFFVSRRFEEGRERFRLHMGYFATLAEAEEWLGIVRDIYPGAWAGEAPGRKLRERATAAQAAQAQHAAGPQTRPPAPRAPEPPVNVPVVHAAPPVARPAPPVVKAPAPLARAAAPTARPAARAPVAPPARPAARATVAPPAKAAVAPPKAPAPPARAAAPPPKAPAPAVKAPPAPARKAAPAASAPAPRAAPPGRPATAPAARVQPQPTRAAAPAAQPAAARPAPKSPAVPAARAGAAPAPAAKAAFGDSNVREVLKALGDASATGETRLMRAPAAPHTPPVQSNSLSDTQVLKMLETRRPEGEPGEVADVSHGSIPLLKPDDTGTRQALKEAVTSNAAVSFAVQLQWSVQPAELDKVPPLAIFSAYTLYTVEGSREGRKWYGLRLGFFSDAISAKQVAYYVRSEFTSVAVVPVSPQEKARASDQDSKLATLAAPAVPRSQQDEFKLIDDAPSVPTPAAPARPAAPTQKVAVGRTVRQPPGAPRQRPAGRVGARAASGPQTLEETLEILGASQLTIDNGSGETLNDSGVRHLRVEVQKNSPFSKLLERLSERMKKS